MATIELSVMVMHSVAAMRVQPLLDEQRVTRHSEAEDKIDDPGEREAGEQRIRRRPCRIAERRAKLPEQVEQRDDRDQRGIFEQRDEAVDEARNDMTQR